jgi:mRNA deadenylase 3'-5' endonuclease subunit Ccr4
MEERKRPKQRKRDNDFKLYTWNRPGAMTMLINALKVYNPDITALQEIGWKGVGNIQNAEGDLYHSCHEQQHIFDTGLLVEKGVKNKIIGFTTVDMRIYTL